MKKHRQHFKPIAMHQMQARIHKIHNNNHFNQTGQKRYLQRHRKRAGPKLPKCVRVV
jgi:hypothetical protein